MAKGDRLGQIHAVLITAQGYLIDKTFVYFNNRDLTDSPLVSLSTPIHFSVLNPFLSSQFPF